MDKERETERKRERECLFVCVFYSRKDSGCASEIVWVYEREIMRERKRVKNIQRQKEMKDIQTIEIEK